MAMAWLVLGPRHNPSIVQRDMTCDRSGAWFINEHGSDGSPRYRTGDGILFWCKSDAAHHAIKLLKKTIEYTERCIENLSPLATDDRCEADNQDGYGLGY